MKYRFIAFKAILSAVIILAMLSIKPIPTSAGFVFGDEPIGGFSYLMDCAYKNEMPKGLYADWYYRAYYLFHYDIEISQSERAILERIVEAEATGGGMFQKMNVASCVIARMQSRYWPNTIESVVFQTTNGTHQFTPVSDGRYYSVAITDSTRDAVDEILRRGPLHNYTYFCSDASYTSGHSWHKANLKYGFFDEMHHYFSEEGR